MVRILPNTTTLNYLGSKLIVDKVELDNEVLYKINFPQPLFIKQVVSDKGSICWQEEGAGQTSQAAVLGDLINRSMSSFYSRVAHKIKG